MITSDKPGWDLLGILKELRKLLSTDKAILVISAYWMCRLASSRALPQLLLVDYFPQHSLDGQKHCGKGEHFQASLSIWEVDLPNQSIHLYACSVRYSWYFHTRIACFVFRKQFYLWALNYTTMKAAYRHQIENPFAISLFCFVLLNSKGLHSGRLFFVKKRLSTFKKHFHTERQLSNKV